MKLITSLHAKSLYWCSNSYPDGHPQLSLVTSQIYLWKVWLGTRLPPAVSPAQTVLKRGSGLNVRLDLYMHVYLYSHCVTLPLPCANAALKLQCKRCRDSSPWTRMHKVFLHGYMAMAIYFIISWTAWSSQLAIHKNVGIWLYHMWTTTETSCVY